MDRVSDGVVRIEVTGCEIGSPWSGSGFLVSPTLVATARHVIVDARTLSLRTTEGVVRGEVIGMDRENDVALVRAVHALPGYEFEFGVTLPWVTDEVAVLGYPYGLPLTTTVGAVSALDRRVEFEGESLDGLIQTDATVNPGNSGGPMIDAAGQVLGVVEAKGGEGIAYAIPAKVVAPLVADWTSDPQDIEAPDCPDPTADLITIKSRHADAPALAATLHQFVWGINESEYESAWIMLTGRRQGAYGDFEDFERKQSTSSISDLVLELVERSGETSDTAEVSFTSRQDPEFGRDGQQCTKWHLEYTLRMDSGYWRIDAAKTLETPAPCEAE
ncbi:MAG: S1C family serine protease [Candidatus Nanopelagicales bacterium]